MRWNRPNPIMLCLTAMMSLPMAALAQAPEGWFLSGSNPASYETGVIQVSGRTGGVAHLSARGASPEGFGTLMQSFYADEHRGRRMRLTAQVRAENVGEWAGVWMRVDGTGTPPPMLAFDNMQNRPITGTTEWQEHSVVLDIPEGAEEIALGVLLVGPGRVLIDDLTFEEVDRSVPVTDQMVDAPREPSGPVNLDFER